MPILTYQIPGEAKPKSNNCPGWTWYQITPDQIHDGGLLGLSVPQNPVDSSYHVLGRTLDGRGFIVRRIDLGDQIIVELNHNEWYWYLAPENERKEWLDKEYQK